MLTPKEEMNALISLLNQSFEQEINVLSDDVTDDLYVWFSVEPVQHSHYVWKEIQLNISSGDKISVDDRLICLSKWNKDGDSLSDLALLYPSVYPSLRSVSSCRPLTLLETRDHYAILDDKGNVVHMSDSRMKYVLPWLRPCDYDTDLFSLDEWMSVREIPYSDTYTWNALDNPTVYVWRSKDTLVASVPTLTEQQRKLLPIIHRDDVVDILQQIECLLPLEDFYMKEIMLNDILFCVLGIRGDHIVFSLRDVIVDLSLHPVFSSVPVEDVISYMQQFDTYEHESDLYDEFLTLRCNFEHLNKIAKNTDTLDIDVQYAVSRLQAGYSYYLHVQQIYTKHIGSYSYVKHPFKNTDRDIQFDARVRDTLDEKQITYSQVKHRVHIQWHDDAIFDMNIPEDIPQSILKKGKIIEKDEGGCCSQRECGGYTLEFDILIRGKSYLKTPQSTAVVSPVITVYKADPHE